MSDTHMVPAARPDVAVPRALERLRAADLIVHAGDWSTWRRSALAFGALGPPVVGVPGNVEEAGGAGGASGDRRDRGGRRADRRWCTTAERGGPA